MAEVLALITSVCDAGSDDGHVMALDPRLLAVLACPQDKGPLYYLGDNDGLYNPRLRRRYPSATASR